MRKFILKLLKQKQLPFSALPVNRAPVQPLVTENRINQLKLFGEKIGIAFQIRDDLFGYTDTDVGKPNYSDIKEKKITLPLIYTLNTCDYKLKKETGSDNQKKIKEQ